MSRVIAALVSGLLFGLGLTVSEMIDPTKVIGFLDLAGDWDPSLAFVMVTAIPIAAIGYAVARRFRAPLCAPSFNLPARSEIDWRLVLGAVLFGIGWGTVGYCPGPARASVSLGDTANLTFVAAMLAGMGAYSAIEAVRAIRSTRA